MSKQPHRLSHSARAFVITPYVAGPDGRLAAQIPSCCPAGGRGEPGCRLVIEYHRHRKTGPEHPLTVVRCQTHGFAFTLYPPGYAPYRRQPVLRVAPDGQPILADGDQELTDFGGTVLEAALNASRSRRQTSDPGPDTRGKRSGTPRRHLRLAAQLVGVARDLTDRVRWSIAEVLSVAALELRDGSRAVGFPGIGAAVCAVLARLRGGARRALKLLVCGHLAGRWGEPLQWDPQRRILERSPRLVVAGR